MSSFRILVLGPDQGWHADQLRAAAAGQGHHIQWCRYELLSTAIDTFGLPDVVYFNEDCQRISLKSFDRILARTMPSGSLEQITLRLSMLHTLSDLGHVVINHPAGMEYAIDKYRTLTRVAKLGYPIPETEVVQTRRDAMLAYDHLGGDVVVKPLFGGEGRGVMRVQDRELAWYTFSTLEQLNAAIYVQKFIRPGGVDLRLLVIGDQIFGIRRFAGTGWKTNVSQGGRGEAFTPDSSQCQMARQISDDFQLTIAAVDVIDNEDGPPLVLEVNAVPGWKGAESVLKVGIADRMIAAITNYGS